MPPVPALTPVPEAIQRVVRAALAVHKVQPLSEPVGGAGVAEALLSGSVDASVIERMHRFFTVQERFYSMDLQRMRTLADSALVRSWHLHGADVGRSWAGREFRRQIREDGRVPDDPTVALLRLNPDEVYSRLSLGAWRFEYNLTPKKAARFVEEYHLAKGVPLDLKRAFGESAAAVSNAVLRRYTTPDPFREVMRALRVEDTDYVLAASLDLREMAASAGWRGPLEEELQKTVWTVAPMAAAKLVWAPFVAYAILAVEAPDLLVGMNQGSAKPPKIEDLSIKAFSAYHDAINTYRVYFRPNGVKYVPPTGKFKDLDLDVEDFIIRAFYGRKLQPVAVQKLLGKMRRWTAENKMAGSLFHVFNADWKKGNWQHILDFIPLDADVYGPFQKFVSKGVSPASGVKLQQTLASKPLLKQVASYMEQQGYLMSGNAPQQVKVSDAPAFSSYASKGFAVGIYSEFVFMDKQSRVLLGVFKDDSGGLVYVFQNPNKGGLLLDRSHAAVVGWLTDGSALVEIKAHKDLATGVAVTPGPAVHGSGANPKPPPISEPKSGEASLTNPLFIMGAADVRLGDVLRGPNSFPHWVIAKDTSWITLWPLQMSFVQPEVLLVSAEVILHYEKVGHVSLEQQDKLLPFVDVGGALATQSWTLEKQTGLPGFSSWTSFNPGEQVKAHGKVWTLLGTAQLSGLSDPVAVLVRQASTAKVSGTFPQWARMMAEDASSVQPVVPKQTDDPFGDAPLKLGKGTPPLYPVGAVLESHNGASRYVILDVKKNILTDAWLYRCWRLVLDSPRDVYPDMFVSLSEPEIFEVYKVLTTLPLNSGSESFAMNAVFSWKIPDWMVLSGGQPAAFEVLGQGMQVSYAGEVWRALFPIETAEMLDGNSVYYVVYRYVTLGGSDFFGLPDQLPFFAVLSPEDLSVLAPESTYAPPEVVPEDSYVEDEPDPEQGNLEMSGTQVAHDFIAEKGWMPAVKSEHAAFQFPLGSVQDYKGDKTRTIIGYALIPGPELMASSPFYVIVTEAGNVNYKGAVTGNKEYGPAVGYSQPVLDALLPKPSDVKKKKFPKLNYSLGKTAKAVADAEDLIYVMSPQDSPFNVGTVVTLADGEQALLLGWEEHGASGKVAVLQTVGQKGTTNYIYVSLPKLQKASISYAHKSVVSEEEVVFGKGLPTVKVGIVSGGSGIPVAPAAGWDSPTPVQQPPMALPKGKHVSTGVIAFMPGDTAMAGTESGAVTIDGRLMLLYHPLNVYGGYSLCIPKGTVEKGESLEKAAVREVYEETGCHVKPVAFLGDFAGNTSVTRLFIGTVVGGTPGEKIQEKEECDATTFKTVPIGASPAALSWWGDLVPKSGNDWQQQAVLAALKWLEKHGNPSQVPVDAAVDYSAVCAEGDVPLPPGTTDPATFSPTVSADDVYADVWKTLYFKAPYPVTASMVTGLQKKLAPLGVTPVSFKLRRNAEKGVAFDEQFETPDGVPLSGAGYVSFLGTDNLVHHYMFGVSTSGSVQVLPSAPDGAEYHVVSFQAAASTESEPWFTHPDPTVNALILQVAGGTSLSSLGVTMGTFKTKWLKAAKVPAYAVVTTNLLQDVVSMFVPGGCSQTKHDMLISCLKARMKQTHSKGGKGVALPTTTVDTEAPPTPAVMPDFTAPTVKLATLTVDSYVYKQAALNPQPLLFSDAGGKLSGGSKPNKILNGPGGRWLFKFAHGEDFRAHIDAAAYKVLALVRDTGIPVGVMTFEGQVGSIQPIVEGAVSPPASPLELSQENMEELLAQHAYDMFVGDHDGHVGNLLMKDGRLRAIDKGQAFKFLLMGKQESLDPSWHAPGNFGDGYAKRLLLEWGAGKADIPQSAFAAMLQVIRRVAQLSADVLVQVLDPVVAAHGIGGAKQKELVKKLVDRAVGYEKAWTTVLKKLRKDFAWPSVPVKSVKKNVFTSSAKVQGFGKVEEKVIADVVAAGWQGKSLKMDRDLLENQEVMCRRVLYQQKAGVSVPATLVHFRLSRDGGLQVAKRLYKLADVDESGSGGGSGPAQLVVDVQNGFWSKIYTAIKSINHHLVIKKDQEINQGSIQAVVDLVPVLEGLAKETEDGSGTYASTGESNAAVFGMASQYLQYVNAVKFYNENKAELVGTHSPQFFPFEWEDPPEEEEDASDTVSLPIQVLLRKQSATVPKTVASGKDILVVNLNESAMHSGTQSQFVLHDKARDAHLFLNPPGGVEALGVKEGVESYKGHGWGIIPGEPSAAVVAHLMAMLETVGGIPMRPATKTDREILYWSKQVHALQGGGLVDPKQAGTSVVEKDYVDALARYRKGEDVEALQALREAAASRLGVPAAELDALAGSDVEGAYTRGAGHFRHHRVGWTVKRLQETLGKDVALVHRLYRPILDFFTKHMQHNGALLANDQKTYYGANLMGASPSSDYPVGGAQGVFCCLRKKSHKQADSLVFHPSVLLRLDVYQVGTGDTFGNVKMTRYMQPQHWTVKSGNVGSGSNYQINVRHDIDLQEYLLFANCPSEGVRKTCMQAVTDLGWTFQHGTPATIFRVGTG